MKDWKKFGVMSLASIAVFALGACGQARAGSGAAVQAQDAAVKVAAADTQPSSDANADNGPGCAESMLDNTTQD